MTRVATTHSYFKIRPATVEDVSLILELIRELARYEKLEHHVVATEEDLQESLFGKRRYAEVIIGEYKEKPVAFALFFHNYSTFLGKNGIYLEDLYVMPEYRGNGFGKMLMSYLTQLAVKRHCGRLEWWVLDWNKPALDFYRSLGAEPMDEWTVQRISGVALNNLANEFPS